MATVKGNKNVLAFLDTLGFTEGTTKLGDQQGYNVIVGGGFFSDYSRHPHCLVQYKPGKFSTAAGRYQLLAHYADVYMAQLKLPDFSPQSQDLIAIQQIAECRAMEAIMAGNLAVAVALTNHIWASLPGNKYGQRQVPFPDINAFYLSAGGLLTTQPA